MEAGEQRQGGREGGKVQKWKGAKVRGRHAMGSDTSGLPDEVRPRVRRLPGQRGVLTLPTAKRADTMGLEAGEK